MQVKRCSIKEWDLAEPRLCELQGLMKKGTVVKIHMSQIDRKHRIFGSRFFDGRKKLGDGLRRNGHLFSQNYTDNDETDIGANATKVQNVYQRLILSICSYITSMIFCERHITQTYIQYHADLYRTVYIRAPRELNLTPGFVLKVVEPLYGIPETGLHWYLTYLSHHLETLGM